MLVKWLWSPSEVLWFVIFTKWATPPMWSPCIFFLWFWILQDITTFHKRSQSISCCPHTKSIVFFLVESLCFVAVEKFHIVGNPFLRCFAFLNIGVEFYKTSLDITTFSPSSKFWWNARKMLRNAKIHKKNCNVGNVLHNPDRSGSFVRIIRNITCTLCCLNVPICVSVSQVNLLLTGLDRQQLV